MTEKQLQALTLGRKKGIFRKRPKGIKYNLKVINKGWGLQAGWNRGRHNIYSEETLRKMIESNKGKHFSPKTEFQKGMTSWNKNKVWEEMRGINHPLWKGDGVGYNALHAWIKSRLKKPGECGDCKQIKNLDLANKSGKYERNLSDWLWLCRKCHHRKDQNANKGWKTRKEKLWPAVL